MAELADERFITYREGARLRELLVAAAHEAGFEPRIALESNESALIRRLVARGLGVAILPRSDAAGEGLTVATLVEPSVRRDITLAWRAGRRHTPAAAEFLELARTTYTSAPERSPSARLLRRDQADHDPAIHALDPEHDGAGDRPVPS